MAWIGRGFCPCFVFHFLEQNNRFLIGACLFIRPSQTGLCGHVAWLQRECLFQFLDRFRKFAELKKNGAQRAVAFFELRRHVNDPFELGLCGRQIILHGRCLCRSIGFLDLFVNFGWRSGGCGRHLCHTTGPDRQT